MVCEKIANSFGLESMFRFSVLNFKDRGWGLPSLADITAEREDVDKDVCKFDAS